MPSTTVSESSPVPNNYGISHQVHKNALLFLAELAEDLGRFNQSQQLYRRVLKTLDANYQRALEKVEGR